MPALIAYLIALSLLLGGGYGAVNWLSEPAPVKVATNAPKSGRHHLRPNTLPQASLSAPSGVAGNEFPASTAAIEPPSQETEMSIETIDQAAPLQNPMPAFEIQKPSARKESSTDEAVRAVEPFGVAFTTPDNAAPRPKARRNRQASKRTEKPKLQLMTLRTIEFADGRRETKLIPYRGQARPLVSASRE